MSFQAMTWAVAQDCRSDPAAKLLLLMLANRASHDDGRCYPSLNRLVSETGLSRSSVIRKLALLEEWGLIAKEQTRTLAGTYNVYTMCLPDTPSVTVTPPQCQGDTTPSVTVTPKPIRENQSLEPVSGAGALIDAFGGILSDDMARAVIAHRKAIKRPLTVAAAKALAKQFALTPDPNAAAETMLAHGWQGFKPEWVKAAEPAQPRAQFSKPAWRA